MGGAADPRYALGLLEDGRRRAAAAFLRRAFPDGRPPGSGGSADARLAYALHRSLEVAGPAPESDSVHTRPSDGGVGVTPPAPGRPASPAPPDEVEGAIRALELVEEASEALRSGRIHDLVRAVTAAERAAPPSMLWVRFRVASLLQASFRFTGEPEAMMAALRVYRPLADAVGLPHMAVSARGLMARVHLLAGT